MVSGTTGITHVVLDTVIEGFVTFVGGFAAVITTAPVELPAHVRGSRVFIGRGRNFDRIEGGEAEDTRSDGDEFCGGKIDEVVGTSVGAVSVTWVFVVPTALLIVCVHTVVTGIKVGCKICTRLAIDTLAKGTADSAGMISLPNIFVRTNGVGRETQFNRNVKKTRADEIQIKTATMRGINQ